MATNVANAVGTQRQFAPQVRDTYQKQLIVPSGSTTAGAGSKAASLAKALGVLGDTILSHMSQQDARDEKYGKFMAEVIKNDPNNAGKILTSSQQMLANSNHKELLDNPYTMAALDKYRGENAIRDIRNRYDQDVVAKEGECQTAGEENARWLNFVEAHRREYNIGEDWEKATEDAQVTGDSAPNSASALGSIKPISSFQHNGDSKFFALGFYENMDTYTQNNINRQMAEAGKNREAIRSASFTAKLSDIGSAEHVSQTPIETQVEELKQACTDYENAGGSFYAMLPMLSKAIDERIANNGGKDLDKIFEASVYTDVNGKEWKLKELLPYEDFHGSGIAMDGALREKYMTDIVDGLQKCTSLDEFDKKVEQIKKDNPHIAAVMAQKSMFTSMREDKRREIEYQSRVRSSGRSGAVGKAAAVVLDSATQQNISQWFSALCKGNSYGGGSPITAPLQKSVQNADGSVSKKALTEQEVIGAGQTLLKGILSSFSNGEIDLNECVRQEGKLLTAPQMKAFKNSLNFAVNSSLMDAMNIDWDKATYNTPALQNIQTALDMYHTNPALASSIFSGSTLKDISALSSLSQVEDGISYHSEEGFDGLKKAMQLYGNVYQQEHNEDTKDIMETRLNDAMANADNTAMQIETMGTNADGSLIFNGVYGINDPSLRGKIRNLAKVYIYNGMDGDEAVKQASDQIRGQYFDYHERGIDCIVPKDFFTGVDQEDYVNKGRSARQAITHLIDTLGGTDSVNVVYDPSTNVLGFMNSSTQEQQYFSPDEFSAYVNELLTPDPDTGVSEMDNLVAEEQGQYEERHHWITEDEVDGEMTSEYNPTDMPED